MEKEKKKIKIRQATKDGFIECELPGIADIPSVIDTVDEEVWQQIIADEDWWSFLYEIDGEIYLIRIRKLIPRETWRLMGFSDEDFDKAAAVNSPTQLYKEAGNSIVKDVLMAIFRNMGIEDKRHG